MKKFYGRIYSPSGGIIEEYLIIAGDGKEAAKGLLSHMFLRTLRGTDYPEDARWSVKPLWLAYNQGLIVNAEVSLLPILDAQKMINEFLRELESRKKTTKQLTLAEVVL